MDIGRVIDDQDAPRLKPGAGRWRDRVVDKFDEIVLITVSEVAHELAPGCEWCETAADGSLASGA